MCVRQGEETTFAYDIKEKTNYLAWQGEASEEEQRDMERQIREGLAECARMGIPPQSIIQENRYMYVDDSTQMIQWICIPAAEKNTDKNTGRKTDKKEKPIQAALNAGEDVDVLKEPPLPDTIPEPRSGELYEPFGHVSDKREANYMELEPSEEKNGEYGEYGEIPQPDRPLYEEIGAETAEQMEDEEDPAENSMWNLMGKPSEDFTEDQTEDPTEDPGTVLLSDFDDEKTVLLIPQPDGKAYLESMRTGEKFHICKNITKIGHKRDKVDIWVKDNRTVSREHCVITYKTGCYYMADCGSLNHTYVNDRKLEKDEECLLEDKCRVRLSNEDFVFYTGEE